jgi:DNA-directed RNA polymerase specialized sigma24 family protein
MIGGPTEEQRRVALATLAGKYWYPVYSYIRRDGCKHHDAQDLTQGFFEQVLERENLGGADPEKAKFRTFLLAILKNFLVSEHRRRSAQKRGGGQQIVPLENVDFESRFSADGSHDQSPETLYQRDWVRALLDGVVSDLREEYDAAGKVEIFDALKSNLGETVRGERNGISVDLGMSNGAVTVALHRMRSRFRSLLRQAVKKTLHKDATATEIDLEIRLLLGASEN